MVFRAALVVLLSSAPAPDGDDGREMTIALDEIPEAAVCPSAVVLGRALDSRLPGITAARDERGGGDVLRLQLDDSRAAVVHFALVDVGGQTVLERTLAAPPGTAVDRTSACSVLAETIALVVERYVRHLHYRAPAGTAAVPGAPIVVPIVAPTLELQATPPAAEDLARPLGWLMVGAGARVAPARAGLTRIEPELAADLLALPFLLLSARAAVTLPIEVAVPSTDRGVFRYAALPLRAGIAVPLWLPREAGFAGVTVLVGADLFRAETRDIAVPRRVEGAQPVAEVGLSGALLVGHRLALRPQILLGLRPERAFQLQDPALAGSAVFVDSRFSLRVGLDLAFVLGKK